jgi:hypothetical protein
VFILFISCTLFIAANNNFWVNQNCLYVLVLPRTKVSWRSCSFELASDLCQLKTTEYKSRFVGNGWRSNQPPWWSSQSVSQSSCHAHRQKCQYPGSMGDNPVLKFLSSVCKLTVYVQIF